MKEAILTCLGGLAFSSLLSFGALANPWEVKEGSTLLDGTETATDVAGYMFVGKEYEFTSAQLNLRCRENELQMAVVGDERFLSKEDAISEPNIEIVLKVGETIVKAFAAIENPSQFSSLDRARVKNGPALLELLRQNDGGEAKVQLPVARTGVPEVRKLSLVNIVEVTDRIMKTCGPLNVWAPEKAVELVPLVETPAPQEPLDLDVAVTVGLAEMLVKELVVNQGVTLDELVQALEPLVADKSE